MILDGKKLSNDIIENIKLEVFHLNSKPKIVDILIGNNSSSNLYIKNKSKACNHVGIDFETISFDSKVSEKYIISYIEQLNKDESVDAIMIQLPIPKIFNVNNIVNSISPSKDIDGLSYYNQAKIYNNDYDIIPCTPKGILRMLNHYKIEISDKNVVIIGRSNLIGKPLIHLLLNENANVTICHSKTNDLSKYTLNADILICATDKSELIDEKMLNRNCTVIDVGVSYKEGKIVGNMNKNMNDSVKYITPVPGGVGPMTVSMFLENALICYKKNH